MLGRALKMAFWVTYDHLGKLILSNLAAVALVLVPGMLAYAALTTPHPAVQACLGLPLVVVTLGGAVPVVAAGLAYLAKELVDTRDGAVADFFAGMRQYGRRAAGLGLLYMASVCCLCTSAWFYVNTFRQSLPWLGFVLSALAVWCLVFVTLMGILCMPALVQKREGVWATVKLSATLVIDNPLFMLGLGIQLAAWAALSVVLAPLLLFLSAAVPVVLMTTAYEQLARKYALVAAQRSGATLGPDGAPLAGFVGGIRVVSRNGTFVVDDEQDDYLNRGLRDFMFPWKG